MAVEQAWDVLVCGGGPSGCAAAVAAAREGARVLLVERTGRLGGAATTNLVQPFMGGVQCRLADDLTARLKAVHPKLMDVAYADLLAEAGAALLLHAWVARTLLDGPGKVRGVQVLTKGGFRDLGAAVTIDATGDGDVAYGAGAAFEQGRGEDGLLQPVSIMFEVGGVDKAAGILVGGERQALTTTVPDGNWSELCHAAEQSGELPPNVGVVRIYESPLPGRRILNASQVNGVNGTSPEDLTRAELEARRQAEVIVAFLRHHAPGYEDAFLAEMPAAIGVRETRRFVGLQTLTVDDLLAGRTWPDAVVRRASFVIDIHNPAGSGQADGLARQVQPYDIPYGCLVPRDVDGLLLAGRCISGTHEAHASYRVQRIGMAIGAAAGVAAALAARSGVPPREVDVAAVQASLGLTLAAPD